MYFLLILVTLLSHQHRPSIVRKFLAWAFYCVNVIRFAATKTDETNVTSNQAFVTGPIDDFPFILAKMAASCVQ